MCVWPVGVCLFSGRVALMALPAVVGVGCWMMGGGGPGFVWAGERVHVRGGF